MSRAFQVENHSEWMGWVVKKRGGRRVAVFFRRADARQYAEWKNAYYASTPPAASPVRAEHEQAGT